MTTEYRRAADYLSSLLSTHGIDDLAARLKPDFSPSPQRVPGGAMVSDEAIKRRWEIVGAPAARAELLDPKTAEQIHAYEHNIENLIGSVRLPVGLAGPLRVRGLFAQDDFYVPLATTEATLVASYTRGCSLITEVGGASVMLLNEGLSCSPGFSLNRNK